jgi:hypothetical protein
MTDNHSDLIEHLQKILPYFTKLEELELFTKKPMRASKLFNTIAENCTKLRKLSIPTEWSENVRNFITDAVEIDTCDNHKKMIQVTKALLEDLFEPKFFSEGN